MLPLLARYADAIFWMARYIERAENLARILDVNETFARDEHGGRNWLSVIQLNADVERFEAAGGRGDAESVLSFYILDRGNPTSILWALRAARENARTLRPLISTELWAHINTLHNAVQVLGPGDIAPPKLSRLCSWIKNSCQAHTGRVEGTFYRDQSWIFYQIGRQIERADQTTRLLDIKYHILLPSIADVGSALDISQWNAVLRSAAGYHAFRRVYPSGLSQSAVAGFLLFHAQFPRSVSSCIRQVDMRLSELRSNYRLRRGSRALEELDELCAVLDDTTIDEVITKGLHEFVDWVQIKLIRTHSELGAAFFGYAAEELSDAAQ